MTNPLITLGFIRDHHPCTDGWARLCKAMGRAPDVNAELSIGDIAVSNNAADALWCLDWLRPHSKLLRQDVVRGILLPALERNCLAPFVGVPNGWDYVPNLSGLRQWVNFPSKLPEDFLPSIPATGMDTSQREAIHLLREAFVNTGHYACGVCAVSVYATAGFITASAGFMAQFTYPGYPSEAVAYFESEAQTGDILRTFSPHYFRG